MSTCVHCGKNPVPHFLFWFTESLMLFVAPLNRKVHGSFLAQGINTFLDGLFFIFLRVMLLFRLARFNTDRHAIDVDRAGVLWEDAERRGIRMESLFLFGFKVDFYRAFLPSGVIYFTGLPRPKPLPGAGTSWMDDKAILKQALLKAGLPIARGGCFASWEKLLACFRGLDKPVIIKPRLGSRGRHTTTFIYTEEELRHGFVLAKQLCHWVMLEEHLTGSVYRGTVIDGKLVGVLGGDPPRVTGDGVKTIQELIFEKNATKHPLVADVFFTETLQIFLARSGFTLASVLPQGKSIDLSEKIGVANAGNSFETTKTTHPKVREVLERAAAVVNDPLMGFDFIIADVTADPAVQKWGIIECNGMPFINLHHDPLQGEPNNVAQHVWNMVLK